MVRIIMTIGEKKWLRKTLPWEPDRRGGNTRYTNPDPSIKLGRAGLSADSIRVPDQGVTDD